MPATLEQIEAQVRAYNPDADLTGLDDAYDFAGLAHEGQSRKSGEPFVNHPIEVALILAELHMDTATLKAALLHDVVEDSDVSLAEIRERFGDEVAELVDGVTKLGKIEFESLSEAQSNNLRKMLIAMAKDIRVILIKLADRLHNMRTLAACLRSGATRRRARRWRSTRRSRTGSASRASSGSSRTWRSTTSSRTSSTRCRGWSPRAARRARSTSPRSSTQLDEELAAVGIVAKISGRPKHLYSVYQKMTQKGKDFNEIYDLIALRVIVDSVKDVYGALGTVHSIWKPVPGRFKDYVAMPKFNMYQSLHTTVIGPVGRPLEIQIRTEEMHRTAEYGVAAHWRYKEGLRGDDTFDERLAWLRQMLEWQTELKDPREFMEALKIDLFEDEVFVFTPKGDVICLKRGSTPIDFAYAIHTEVGNHCVGAKVNGSIVPLGYELQMGDRIEILTNKNSRPSRDWLNIVKTSSAKSKIRNYFSKVTREDDLVRGRDELAKVMRKHGLGIGSKTAEKAIEAVAQGDELRPSRRRARGHRRRQGLGEAGRDQAPQADGQGWRDSAKPEPEVEEFTLDKPMMRAAQQAPQAAVAASRSRASTTCSCASRAAAPGAGRRDHRVRDAGPRRLGAPRRLPQRTRTAQHARADHRRRVGSRARTPRSRSRSSSRRSIACGCCRT